MKRYYVATFVVVLCFMYCGQSQEEKLESALREVERLDAMRKKVSEILEQQASVFVLKENEYDDWKASQDAIVSQKKADVVQTEQNLAYWKNWHLNEAKRVKSAWDRTLDDIKARLSQAIDDTIRYWRIRRILPPDRFRRQLAEKRVLINKLAAEIDAHEKTRPGLSHKIPSKRTDKISEWKKKVSDAQESYRVAFNERHSVGTAKLQNLDKLRMDLMSTKASYDSINVLHTKAVLELSKK